MVDHQRGFADDGGRNDYAANGGDVYTSPGAPLSPSWKSATLGEEAGPASLAEGGVMGSTAQAANAKKTFDAIDNVASGVIFCGSMVKISEITDGCSLTYLLGEKYIDPDDYYSGTDPATMPPRWSAITRTSPAGRFFRRFATPAAMPPGGDSAAPIPAAFRWPFATAR